MLQTPMAEASPWQVSWEVLRLLSLMPPPQDLEQLVHVSHVDHSQSTKKKIKSMTNGIYMESSLIGLYNLYHLLF